MFYLLDMDSTAFLTVLNILVAFLGVLFVIFTIFEWRRLSKLRRDMQNIEIKTEKRIYASLRAAHRVLASYQIKDPAQRAALLESSVAACPAAYNAFNALGYAYMDCKDIHKAIDAFTSAVSIHPEDKAGYADLAFAHKTNGSHDLALKYLRMGIAKDPSLKEDLISDSRMNELLPLL